MSVYSRIIREYEQKNKALKAELASEETEIGLKCLEGKSCDEKDSDHYILLRKEFQQYVSIVNDISDLEDKRKNYQADIQQAKKEISELEKKEPDLLLTLGIALYNQPDAASVASFSSAYTEAQSITDSLDGYRTQSQQMTDSLELQNMFSRLVTKVRIATLSNTIGSHQKKLDSVLVAGARSVMNAQDLPSGLSCAAYEACISYKNTLERLRIQLAGVVDELENVEQTLRDLGRKSAAQGNADAKNDEILAFGQQTGHAFDKKYITRDGDVLAPFPAEYRNGLERVKELRMKLASVNRRLDILHYSEQIDDNENAGKSLAKELEANRQKIEKLVSRNEELMSLIEDNRIVVRDLNAHRSAVEKEEGMTVGLIMKRSPSDAYPASFTEGSGVVGGSEDEPAPVSVPISTDEPAAAPAAPADEPAAPAAPLEVAAAVAVDESSPDVADGPAAASGPAPVIAPSAPADDDGPVIAPEAGIAEPAEDSAPAEPAAPAAEPAADDEEAAFSGALKAAEKSARSTKGRSRKAN